MHQPDDIEQHLTALREIAAHRKAHGDEPLPPELMKKRELAVLRGTLAVVGDRKSLPKEFIELAKLEQKHMRREAKEARAPQRNARRGG